jgi:hypothetical protein
VLSRTQSPISTGGNTKALVTQVPTTSPSSSPTKLCVEQDTVSVKIETAKGLVLQLFEVGIYSGGVNVAADGISLQSSDTYSSYKAHDLYLGSFTLVNDLNPW